MSVIGSAKSNSSPGNSNIGYNTLKQLTKYAHDCLRHLAFWCYQLKTIPIKWKMSNIIPIPKTLDWNFNLKNARPIILLECVQKLTLKIVRTRLMHILKD